MKTPEEIIEAYLYLSKEDQQCEGWVIDIPEIIEAMEAYHAQFEQTKYDLVQIENLRALVSGIDLNAYQRSLAIQEFEKLIIQFDQPEKVCKWEKRVNHWDLYCTHIDEHDIQIADACGWVYCPFCGGKIERV